MQTRQKLRQLREQMQEHQLAGYVIPGTDEHQNEYLPEMWKRREWLSGFTGSAGSVAVTADRAGLWTDSRYFLQAETQLEGSGISLFKMGQPATPDIWQWLKNQLPAGSKVGIDARLISVKQAAQIEKKFHPTDLQLQFMEKNLVDAIWTDRPAPPLQPARPHPEKYSGEALESKLGRLREELLKENCNALILTTLDTIAWIFNLRGNDIAYNPLTIAYAIITDTDARLFIDNRKITASLKEHLGQLVSLFEYEEFKTHLRQLKAAHRRFWIDERHTNAWIAELIKEAQVFRADNPVIHFKAVKNSTEITNFKAAHLRDGVAMVKFLVWLYENVPSGQVSEDSAALRLRQFREEQALFQDLSFTTISAYGAHGAIVHYSHTAASNSPLRPEGLYLLDSGAHYLDGTTDITRTICLGDPTELQRLHFTKVLQGQLDLAHTSFPEGTQGIQLDAIARKPLWDIGLDYGHGTGHGIGSYLNVHEGPHAISQSRGVLVKLQPGMFCSIEPGYYAPGKYGIRTENIVYIILDAEKTTPETAFYRFETITLCPIDLKLIDPALLTEKQRHHLNAYHREVKDKLSPLLNFEERGWLEQATHPLGPG